MSSSRGRNIIDSEDEEMEYAPSSSKRTKLSTQENVETEDQVMLVDDDG